MPFPRLYGDGGSTVGVVKVKRPPGEPCPRGYRGGAWYLMFAADARCADRARVSPGLFKDGLGFCTVQSGCRQQVLKGVTLP